ncbi:MAG: glutamate--tRNA ligase [Halobacteriovoraceae bacterium]|nr:glutamate--tRNA ligase [Halobacteriovoraceae bacterium]
MSVRVRFAPSPTGYLHIGGARTALYCHLIAKAKGGTFVLRIEDTDLERSKKEYEVAMIEDLKWCGLEHNEGPDVGGDFGPYRQSERIEMYKQLADQLVEEGKAYYCFLSDEELEELTEKAKAEKISPHAYHDKYRDFDPTEAKKKVEAGESHVIRFKNPRKKYTFTDLVRGEVTFPEDMVGDFVIIRSNGMPVYNFCCVIDDWKMEMTHVMRAEEHLNNTVRQLMVYEAFGVTPPEFAHCSLLVGEDRQKLSKRHGATSVVQYKDQNFLPQALMNYLCLLGWSHPEEKDVFKLEDIESVFTLDRFQKAPALYDIEKLKHFNGEHMRMLTTEDLVNYLAPTLESSHPFHSMDKKWQESCLEFFKEKFNIPSELPQHLDVLFSTEAEKSEAVEEVKSWESTQAICDYVKSKVEEIATSGASFITVEQFNEMTDHCKKELKIKGKFLFKGLRLALTGMAEGPDLKVVIPLTPIEIMKKRQGLS